MTGGETVAGQFPKDCMDKPAICGILAFKRSEQTGSCIPFVGVLGGNRFADFVGETYALL
jgi:hypothetical protein